MADPNPWGWEHQKRRDEILSGSRPQASGRRFEYGDACPRCGLPMERGQVLDLGHTVDVHLDSTAIGDRIEHASCNRSAGAVAGNEQSRFDQSRDW